MKKRLLALLLSTMMVMSLVACGGGDDTTSGDDQQIENEADVDVEEDEADADVEDEEVVDETAEDFYYVTIADHNAQEAMSIPESLVNTKWNFAGGMLDGEEMDGDEGLAVLNGFGGTFDLAFGENDTVQLITAEETIPGQCLYTEDDTSLVLVMENGEVFSCVYTEVPFEENGEPVSVLVAYGISEEALQKEEITEEDLQDAFYFLFAE